MGGKLAGKVALVTGASKSIGQTLAVGLAAAGAAVAVNFKNDAEGAQATCRTIGEAGGQSEAFQADIGSKAEFEQLVERVCDRFGRIDILVNNAARTRFGHVFEITEEDFDDVVDTNLRGPFFGSAAAAKKMIAQGGGGSIINISSCAAKVIMPHHSSYTMAKGGLEALTRQLAIELAPHVRVNAIAPAPTSNERNRGYDPDYDRKWAAVMPVGRVAYAEDYIGAAVFLAGDDSALLTGQILNMDGGWTLIGFTPNMANFDFSTDRARD